MLIKVKIGDTVTLNCYGYQIKYENVSVKILDQQRKKWVKAAFELLLVLFFDRSGIVF